MNLITKNYPNGVQLLNDFDRLLTNSLRQPLASQPQRHRIREDENAWYLRVELPGFEKEQIEIELKEDTLSLKATPAEGDEELSAYEKRFTLPEEANKEQLKAELKNGVLLLTLPKAEPVTPETRRIEIN